MDRVVDFEPKSVDLCGEPLQADHSPESFGDLLFYVNRYHVLPEDNFIISSNKFGINRNCRGSPSQFMPFFPSYFVPKLLYKTSY